MDGQPPAVHIVGLLTEEVEKLGVHHGNQEVEGAVRIGHDEEQRRFPVAQSVQFQLIVGGDLPQFGDVEGGQSGPAGNQNRLSSLAESEIAFIHTADTEAKKKELFAKVRTGQVRILLGSTAKMGAGTNVQDRLVAVHHLDVGWKPSDMTQRNGRIIRQGNRNKTVQIYNYVTEGTFDAYLFQTLENKQRFIGQIMTSKSPVRSCEDVDEQVLSYAEGQGVVCRKPAHQGKDEPGCGGGKTESSQG